jgi:hypothetical protein
MTLYVPISLKTRPNLYHVPFDARRPDPCQRGRQEHDGEYLRDSDKDLAMLRVVDAMVAGMNSP